MAFVFDEHLTQFAGLPVAEFTPDGEADGTPPPARKAEPKRNACRSMSI
ncbi:hypothetical protein [Actinomadura miaoliensis]